MRMQADPRTWAPHSRPRHSSPMSGLVLMIACTAGLWLATVGQGCSNPPSPATVKSDLTTALDLTQAACSVADTTGVAYVILGCAITTTLENGAVSIANLFVPVATAKASAILAAHPETEASKPLVIAWKAIHPTAAVGPLPR
jgi:hypothetical protein